MRKLATIRKISDIQPIEGADAIEVATVDGWKVVVKKNEFAVGSTVIYLEIDSWVPHELAPFLSKGQEPREYNGVRGERLRTVKLRGQISQGLLLPVDSTIRELPQNFIQYLDGGYVQFGELEPVRLWETGTDLTDILGIEKWEPPIHPQLAGLVRGPFPTNLVPKTDQERIQNYWPEIEAREDATYEVTLKLDGTSVTLFKLDSEIRVCSRNLEMKTTEENADNTLVKLARRLEGQLPEGYAFQGELMGPGIQGNREGFKEHRFFVFDIYIIGEGAYLEPDERRRMCNELGLEHTLVYNKAAARPVSVDDGLAQAEGPSINHPIREGLVWKCNEDPSFSFKTISNKFLLKGGD